MVNVRGRKTLMLSQGMLNRFKTEKSTLRSQMLKREHINAKSPLGHDEIQILTRKRH